MPKTKTTRSRGPAACLRSHAKHGCREGLYKALSGERSPDFDTIAKCSARSG
jgi:DNA-binding phage protein